MAYTGKTGLDYFPFEVNFFEDDKIELIESEFGPKGLVITMKLLCKIYKEGYFYRWGDDECLLFSKKAGAGIDRQLVDEVVKGLLRRSFFSKEVYDQFTILTSRGIQYRYLEAAERRKSVHISADYLLTDLSKFKNVYIVDQNGNILPKNEYIFRQRKGKEKKGEESNVDALSDAYISDAPKETKKEQYPPVAPPPPNQNKGPSIEEVRKFFNGAGGTTEMSTKFWNKYEGLGWMNGITPIRNWTGFANNFISTYKENDRNNGTGRKQTTASSIQAVDAASAELIRDLDAAAREQHPD